MDHVPNMISSTESAALYAVPNMIRPFEDASLTDQLMTQRTKLIVLPNPLLLPDASATSSLWLDASDTSRLTFDGSLNIVQVLDKSEQNNTMIHPAGMTNAISGRATTLNGLSALRFNRWVLRTTNVLNVNIAQDSYFFLVRVDSINGYSFFAINDLDGQRQMFVNSTTLPTALRSFSPSVSSSDIITQGKPMLLEVVRTSGMTTLYVNGGSVGTVSATGNPGGQSRLFIGASNNDNFIEDYVLGEMLVFSGFLTTTDRLYIENYFKLKWGLP